MPYSKNQQTSAHIALAVKKGKLPKNKLKGASKTMYNSMSLNQLKDFATGTIKKSKRKRKTL